MNMPNTSSPEIEQLEAPPLETAPRRSGGWLRHLIRRVKLALSSDNEALLVENKTKLSWRIYRDYHLLGIVDTDEERTFHLTKHGTLNVRPLEGENVEYLMLSLNDHMHHVRIYKRCLDKETEVYDMKHVA